MSIQPILPVDTILPEIIESLRRSPNLVIEAPPGAGKTTRVPSALLPIVPGEVLVLEPRRIAARLAARRVAYELGEEVGKTVGYQVRFEEAIGPSTRLRFVTEGVLNRRLLYDPALNGVSAVILDEFHERHIDTDLALALLKRLQRIRPELRIVVMSATLESKSVSEYLFNCPILRSEGRLFDISVEHLPYSPALLEQQVRGAVERLVGRVSGDILTFLPGAAEIHRTMRACADFARQADMLVLPLHGSLSPQEQDVAVAPANRRKLILATNIAESSITVEGVTAVIDSGLARFASYSSWSGLPNLMIGRVSKASAKQRAGRAGRTAPGHVLRLYTEQDLQQRPEHDTPEIVRSDLSQLCLLVRAMGIEISDLDWLDAPQEDALRNANELLDRLGAKESVAEQLARYPLPPRLSRILVESMKRGVGEQGCIAAALLGAGVTFKKNDLLAEMETVLDPRVQQHVHQLRKIARPSRQKHHDDDAILMSVLAGFPDRVALLRSGNQILLSTGASAEVIGERPRYEYMVAVDAEDRSDKPLPAARMVGRIEPEWLIDLFPERVREEDNVTWNRATSRVEAISALYYDNLVIQETRGRVPEPESAAELLAQKAQEEGIERFADMDALNSFLGRLEFAGCGLPDVSQVLRELCRGLTSFAELKQASANFTHILESQMKVSRLAEIAPTRILLKNGHQTPVHYERGKQPWIASRLQDFFGMKETPRIGPTHTPVVIHLLAPNRRAVQTTQDLAGFWERLYPQVRRELMRRYPKHSWPERPL